VNKCLRYLEIQCNDTLKKKKKKLAVKVIMDVYTKDFQLSSLDGSFSVVKFLENEGAELLYIQQGDHHF
jgi:hypothetical protein